MFLCHWDQLIDLEAKETEVQFLKSVFYALSYEIYSCLIWHSLKSLPIFFLYFSLHSLFQLLKKEVWRSHSLNIPNSGGLSSIVLDASYGIPHQKSVQDNRFVYRFVRQDTSCLSEVSDGEHFITSSSNLDITLRSGDYVVWIISFNSFK